jgi:hypothetical protein
MLTDDSWGGNNGTALEGSDAPVGTAWLSEFLVSAYEYDPVALVTETDGSTVVSEQDPTLNDDTIEVVLSGEPTENVLVEFDPNISGDDITLVGADPCGIVALTFEPGNWDTPQTVTVRAVDDSDEEGTHYSFISVNVSSDDLNFDNVFTAPIAVKVLDNDLPEVQVAASDGTTEVSEEGETSDTYTVKLGSPPTDSVTVAITDSSDPDQVTVTASLEFTSSTWNTPQTVTVTAIDDEIAEADPHGTQISHVVSSEDLDYGGISVSDVEVSITDNDCPAGGPFPAGDNNEDCVVDLKDLAIIASEWLDCTLPNVPGCQ